ncbi:ATP synthase subunit I [Paucisalibacillus globulus]|uniref:ATP synthase subunit I n=1 Tax=Paucisalibacillus globulus TaxID=351095 RepID=UPI000BB8CA0D|nr:ATP synthase subunit I [Paucisalibacillus globulus]
MTNNENQYARQRKWMFYLLAILVLGAGFTPYLRVFLGLLLGSAISFYNLYLLQKKTIEFTEAVAKSEKPRGIGMISRFAAASLAVIIALRYEEYFDMIAVIIGLMTSYLVIMIDFLMNKNKDSA